MEQHPPTDGLERCDVCGLTPVVRGMRRASRVVARSEAMREVLKRAARFAGASAPIMILGETGTGKEVVARAIHASSTRSDKPFVAVNVAALPAPLLESELFGHARGAFTGAASQKEGLFHAASQGTLFLDEIGEMPLALQAKLLRALQDGEVRRVGDTRSAAIDVRIISATHRDLSALSAEGSLRQDLLYRLKVLTLSMPALRQRREDILPLASMFLREENRPDLRLSSEAEHVLQRYAWPGNVRELQNAMKHGAALADDRIIHEHHLPDDILLRQAEGRPARAAMRTLADVEREHVLAVLAACGGSQMEAARVLGIGRNTLWRKLRAYEGTAGGPSPSPGAPSA